MQKHLKFIYYNQEKNDYSTSLARIDCQHHPITENSGFIDEPSHSYPITSVWVYWDSKLIVARSQNWAVVFPR